MYDISRIEESIDREEILIVQGKRLGNDVRDMRCTISFWNRENILDGRGSPNYYEGKAERCLS